MNYSIDFSKVSLEQFKKDIKNKTFIPSRQIIKDEVDIHFDAFKKAKINNCKELQSIINDKKAKVKLLKDSVISDEYLTVLLREMNSIQAKPLKLKEFNWILNETINKIEKTGISNTKILYERLGKSKERKEFSKTTGINEKEIIELLKLSDLVRIQWVNSTFAHILYLTDFDTVEKVSKADHKDLYNKVASKNDEMKLYKGKIGLNDMKLCIEAAKYIEAEIEV